MHDKMHDKSSFATEPQGTEISKYINHFQKSHLAEISFKIKNQFRNQKSMQSNQKSG